jgi:NAD(P)-dependent dehydrogenase (short-subunit alcohol dehydrogenase family)
MRLQGKVAIITGAGGSVGTATALRFAREGAAVVLNDVVSTHLDGVVREIADVEGGKAVIALGDVTRSAHVDRVVREALEAFGRIDVLVNHAGATEDILVTGASLCADAVLPLMRERRWGRVINSSPAADVAARGYPAEVLGKSVVTLTRTLAVANARFGVTVNCVAAGITRTPTPSEAQETTLALIPMGRFGDPREIAAAHVFLASDDASYVTGQVLCVDGGLSVAS